MNEGEVGKFSCGVAEERLSITHPVVGYAAWLYSTGGSAHSC